MQFYLRDALAGGSPVGNTNTIAPIVVNSGLFTVTLDFGAGIFTGPGRWLEIGVRTNGSLTAYTILAPRQPLSPVPYAITAESLNGLQIQGNANGAPNTILGASVNYIAPGTVGAVIGGGGATNFTGPAYTTSNSVAANFGIVGGGLNNVVQGAYSIIGGGYNNTVGADTSVIGGGGFSAIGPAGFKSVIAGGFNNSLNASYAAIGGGNGNSINGDTATVSGGDDNLAAGDHAVIGGGSHNSAKRFDVVGGGRNNVVGADFSGILAGDGNLIAETTSLWSLIGGGQSNVIYNGADHSVIDGGGFNTIRTNALYSTIGGGAQNTIQTNANYSAINGGAQNVAGGSGSTVSGGHLNGAGYETYVSGSNVVTIIADFATIGGGAGNLASGNYATVAGGFNNLANGSGSFIGGGGGSNWAYGDASAIVGGIGNSTHGSEATVGGGEANEADGVASFIGAGLKNYLGVYGDASVIGGGEFNATGDPHYAPSYYATIGGGGYNTNYGQYATIPGGYRNLTEGAYSFAAGQSAQALQDGAFVWADDSSGVPFASTAKNQFLVRAVGGVGLGTTTPSNQLSVAGSADFSGKVGIGTGAPVAQLDVVGNQGYARLLSVSTANGSVLELRNNTVGFNPLGAINFADGSGNVPGQISYADPYFSFRAGGVQNSMTIGPNVVYLPPNVSINTSDTTFNLVVNGSAGKPGGGSWSNYSDKRLKKNISALSGVLDKLLGLRGVSFEYKDPGKIHELPGRRIGMIAQEVEKVFPDWVDTGKDGFKRVTFRGFEALTVEALRELRAEKDAKIAALESQLAEHKAKLAGMEARFARLEKELARLAETPAETLIGKANDADSN